jgi:hypothetical protein
MHGANGKPTNRTEAEKQEDYKLALPLAERGCKTHDQDSCNYPFLLTGKHPDESAILP